MNCFKPVFDAKGRWQKLLIVSASHLLVSPCDLPSRLTLKVHTKYKISLPTQYRKWDTVLFTSGDMSIHRSWSVPNPSLDAWCRWEELLWASFYLLWFSPTYVPQRLTLKLHKTPDVGIALSVPTVPVDLRGETFIAYEVFQNHPKIHDTDGRSS